MLVSDEPYDPCDACAPPYLEGGGRMSNERPLLREPVSAWTYDPCDAFAPPNVGVGVPETGYFRPLRDRLTDLYITISS